MLRDILAVVVVMLNIAVPFDLAVAPLQIVVIDVNEIGLLHLG
jgi:hypothetical protein